MLIEIKKGMFRSGEEDRLIKIKEPFNLNSRYKDVGRSLGKDLATRIIQDQEKLLAQSKGNQVVHTINVIQTTDSENPLSFQWKDNRNIEIYLQEQESNVFDSILDVAALQFVSQYEEQRKSKKEPTILFLDEEQDISYYFKFYCVGSIENTPSTEKTRKISLRLFTERENVQSKKKSSNQIVAYQIAAIAVTVLLLNSVVGVFR